MEIIGHFQTSLHRALDEIDPNYKTYNGLIVCGTHTPEDLDLLFTLNRIKSARLNKRPFLGICFGHQLAAIEYARNVLNIYGATSEEFEAQTGPAVVVRRPEGLKVGLHDGETYWSNFMVRPDIEEGWQKPPNFLTVPFHPEYESSIDKPHPLLVSFLNICKK